MEDIFQLLLFVGFAIVGVVIQWLKKDAIPQPQPVSPDEETEEMFPEWNQEAGMSTTQPIEAQPISKKKKKKNPKVEIRKPEETGTKPSETPPSPSQAERKIRLSNREEARRAFIYSEIFNRKY